MDNLIQTLKNRFMSNMNRHVGIVWDEIELKLKSNPKLFEVIQKMEDTGGEPDVVTIDGNLCFVDCSMETPKGRLSLCYDEQALNERKENKPVNSAKGMATDIGITILNESQYIQLQSLGDYDNKTSSWIDTPNEVRELGGAIFGDKRFGRVFIYHNGAQSYYASRGFRGYIKI